MNPRYFIHVDGFTHGAAYIEAVEKLGTVVCTDGSRARPSATFRIEKAENLVRMGLWREITEEEAKSLVKP